MLHFKRKNLATLSAQTLFQDSNIWRRHFTTKILFSEEVTFCLSRHINRHVFRVWVINISRAVTVSRRNSPNFTAFFAGWQVFGPCCLPNALCPVWRTYICCGHLSRCSSVLIRSYSCKAERRLLAFSRWSNGGTFRIRSHHGNGLAQATLSFWPLPSPDFSPLDVVLCWHLKDVVYVPRLSTALPEFAFNKRDDEAEFTPAAFTNVLSEREFAFDVFQGTWAVYCVKHEKCAAFFLWLLANLKSSVDNSADGLEMFRHILIS